MAEVKLRKIVKFYDDVEAVRGIDLDIADHEFVVLVGPSGCGKSTALRMIAGLDDISSGELNIGGDVVNDRSPKDRDIAMVFQNYALYPHMTVRENMGFALKLHKLEKAEINKRVEEAAEILDLTEQAGVTLRLARIKPAVRELLARDGVLDRIGDDKTYDEVDQAVAAQMAGQGGSRAGL